MKALTIRQPWASLIALGVKTIETRSWRAPQSLIGQRIAIHAGKHRPSEFTVGRFAVRTLGAVGMYDTGNNHDWTPLPLGAVVCTAVLADCVPMIGANDEPTGGHLAPAHLAAGDRWYLCDRELRIVTDITDQVPYGDFQPGRWAWMLTDVEPCEPVPAKGKQGLWESQL